MILTEHLKAIAGRWFDANFPPPQKLPASLPQPIPVYGVDSDDDGTGTWIPAGLVDLYDHVNVAGRWYEVTGTDVVKPCGTHPGRAVLYFGGWHVGCGYGSQVYVRDEIAAIATEIEELCDGLG